MRQVTFSSQSLDVISSIPQIEQLSLVEKLSSLSGDILLEKRADIGKFTRKGKTYYRVRLDDFRIYIERNQTALHCQYILEKNSFQDFMIRCNLPSSEESVIEKHQSFWDYLDSLRKK
jgi:mRNA-degrading endonuclease RelE of RelBE toxin-antitoxin system